MDFIALAEQCAPAVHPQTMAAVARVESSLNPFAIGVVGGRLERQPANKSEAVVTAKALEQAGFNFSVGIGQVNRYNLPKYGLDYERAFDACPNLHAASLILKDCFDRAKSRAVNDQAALQSAFSCYYSGNFQTGFYRDFAGQPSYVQKVLAVAGAGAGAGTGNQGLRPIKVITDPKPTTAAKTRTDSAVRLTVQTEDRSTTPIASSVYGGGGGDSSAMVFR